MFILVKNRLGKTSAFGARAQRMWAALEMRAHVQYPMEAHGGSSWLHSQLLWEIRSQEEISLHYRSNILRKVSTHVGKLNPQHVEKSCIG